MSDKSQLPELVKRYESQLLTDWIKEQLDADTLRPERLSEAELRDQAAQFLKLFRQALQSGELAKIDGAPWKEMRNLLEELSRSRVRQGFSPIETAMFVFSLKQPIFAMLQKEYAEDPQALHTES